MTEQQFVSWKQFDNEPYPWPAQRRAAATLTFDVDSFTPYLWRTRHQKRDSLSEMELRTFGLRTGVWRVKDLLSEFGLKATFFIPAAIAAKDSELVEALLENGHEIGLHGYIHENTNELSLDENKRILERSHKILTSIAGKNTRFGYRSPSWSMTYEFHKILREFGVRYDSSLMGAECPYSIDGLPELPVSWVLDDATYLFYLGDGTDMAPPAHPDQVLHQWRGEISALRAASGLINITCHPWIIGRAARLEMLRQVLSELVSYRDIWVATCGEIATHHGSLPSAKSRPITSFFHEE